ncbi:hypothetical protein LCGC14_1195370 [marine sediment metagenome]|uniref:Uncharacterized protein n=1 Tax=marine sediment metagenome TaxID=412755 RepID=A0A0F9P0W8_9ZZZZ
MAEETAEQKDYLDAYREEVRKLQVLSTHAVRQFLGTREEGDPRVDYLVALEAFKNMANAQISCLLRLATEKLGVSQEDFLAVATEELGKQVETMQEDLAVIGWNEDGTVKLDLQAHLEKTRGWPL